MLQFLHSLNENEWLTEHFSLVHRIYYITYTMNMWLFCVLFFWFLLLLFYFCCCCCCMYIFTIAFIICVFYSLRGLFHYFLLFLLVDFLQTLYDIGVSMQEFVNLFWSELFAPLWTSVVSILCYTIKLFTTQQ